MAQMARLYQDSIVSLFQVPPERQLEQLLVVIYPMVTLKTQNFVGDNWVFMKPHKPTDPEQPFVVRIIKFNVIHGF